MLCCTSNPLKPKRLLKTGLWAIIWAKDSGLHLWSARVRGQYGHVELAVLSVRFGDQGQNIAAEASSWMLERFM